MTGGRQHNHCLQEWSFLITTVLAYVDNSSTQLSIFDTHLNLGGLSDDSLLKQHAFEVVKTLRLKVQYQAS